MNYGLRIQLRDANFPFNHDGDKDCVGRCGFPEEYGNEENTEPILHTPTLSELILACGERFEGLRKYINPDIVTSKVWSAGAYLKGRTDACIEASASTPEEAVSLLYLELNQQRSHFHP